MANRQEYEANNPAEAAQFETDLMERMGRERADAMSKVSITIVDDDEQDDLLAETLLAQELDLVTHRMNFERFETMLTNGITSGRPYIVMLSLQTLDRIATVTATIEALTPQLPSPGRHTAAVARVKARRDAAQPQIQP